MSHPEQRDLVATARDHLPGFFSGSRVLEVGSLDINGSIRSLFSDCDYTGIDVGEGPGVDRVIPGQLADYPSGHFDVTISCECLEHNPWWRETLTNMFRMTRLGGLVIMTCAGPGRPEHGTTRTNPALSPHTEAWDYYANLTPRTIARALPLDLWLGDRATGITWSSHDTWLVGLRGDTGATLGELPAALGELTRIRDTATHLDRIAWMAGGEPGARALRGLRRHVWPGSRPLPA